MAWRITSLVGKGRAAESRRLAELCGAVLLVPSSDFGPVGAFIFGKAMGSGEADNTKVPHFVREDNLPGVGRVKL